MAKKKTEKPASEIEDPKEAFMRRLEVQLEEWSAKIDHMRAQAERKEFDEQLRRKYYERAQALRDRVSDATAELQDLKKSSEKAWKDVRKDLERTWSDIKSAFGSDDD